MAKATKAPAKKAPALPPAPQQRIHTITIDVTGKNTTVAAGLMTCAVQLVPVIAGHRNARIVLHDRAACVSATLTVSQEVA